MNIMLTKWSLLMSLKIKLLIYYTMNQILDNLLEKLTKLFLKNPSCTRKNREVPRRKSSDRVLINHHKRLKKVCF